MHFVTAILANTLGWICLRTLIVYGHRLNKLANMSDKKYQSLKEFYPYYLTEHSNTICRRLHFVGSLLVILVLVVGLTTGKYSLLWSLPLIGYGFAWVGHFFFEKNKPATFTYPLYSFICDWIMFKDILLGKIKF